MKQAELLGIPPEFEFRGKAYKVAPITFEIEGAFAAWVHGQALRRLERSRAMERASPGSGLTEEQYERALDRLADNVAAGEFEWGSVTVARAGSNLAGAKHLMYLRLRKFSPDVTPVLVDDLFDDDEAMRRLAAILNPPAAAGDRTGDAPAADLPAAP